MITLGYCLSDEWNKDLSESDLTSMDESGLRYRFFMGDIEFRVSKATFDAPWGWVPILDFAVCLLSIVRSVPGSGESIFQFTESEAEIFFLLKGAVLEISATYTNSTASISYVEMSEAAEAFAVSVFDAIETLYPMVRSNVAYMSMRRKAIGV